MRPHRAIQRLIACGPPLLEKLPLPPHRCIVATRVAIDVLARFGIEAQPRSVLCAVANAAYATWRARILAARQASAPRRWLEPKAPAAALCVWAGLPDYAPPAGQWPGHLIAFLPAEAQVIDLDFRAFARPDRGLAVPPAVVAHWPAKDAAVTYSAQDRRGHTFYVRYERQDDNAGYTAAEVWKPGHPDIVAIVAALERSMRLADD